MATPLFKTLDQELQALVRGISLECLVCGEFVLRTRRTVSCPECGSHVRATIHATEESLEASTPA